MVKHATGLHARPAALFVRTASRFAAAIDVVNVTAQGRVVNAKSILMVLSLGVLQGHAIQVRADGADEAEAIAALTALVESNFGES